MLCGLHNTPPALQVVYVRTYVGYMLSRTYVRVRVYNTLFEQQLFLRITKGISLNSNALSSLECKSDIP